MKLMRFVVSVGVLALVLNTVACSPVFNWRAARVEGTALQVDLPCTPELAQRQVALPSGPVMLSMMACEAGGSRFALGWMRPPVADEPLLVDWQRASLSSVGLGADDWTAATQQWTWRVPGATVTRTLQAQGKGPDGRAVMMRAVYFVRGGYIYQAAVYGPGANQSEAAPFFESLRLP